MINKEEKKREEDESTAIEYIDTLKTLTLLNKRGVALLVASFFVSAVLKWVFKLPIPLGVVTILFFFSLIISLYVYLLRRFLSKAQVDISMVETLSFCYFLANILLYSLIVHYIGGVEWVGIFIYFFIIVEANILLPARKGIMVTIFATLSYLGIALLECYQLIPHHNFITSETGHYKDLVYIAVTVGGGAVFGFQYVAFITRLFSGMFKDISSALKVEREELMKVQVNLKDSKDTLEVRVRARTEELEEMTKNLEKEVAKRTEELQNNIEELEKFHKFAIGREMKMVELKKELEKLKKE